MTVHFAEACGVFLHTGVFYLKLRADFAGFWEEPDVFSSYSDTAYTVQKEDKLADLSKYFTEEELSQYVDSYIQDGYFNQDGALYLFPVAKSAEITMINKTDWEPFAEATGTTVDELTTTEGITEVAGRSSAGKRSIGGETENLCNHKQSGSLQQKCSLPREFLV